MDATRQNFPLTWVCLVAYSCHTTSSTVHSFDCLSNTCVFHAATRYCARRALPRHPQRVLQSSSRLSLVPSVISTLRTSMNGPACGMKSRSLSESPPATARENWVQCCRHSTLPSCPSGQRGARHGRLGGLRQGTQAFPAHLRCLPMAPIGVRHHACSLLQYNNRSSLLVVGSARFRAVQRGAKRGGEETEKRKRPGQAREGWRGTNWKRGARRGKE